MAVLCIVFIYLNLKKKNNVTVPIELVIINYAHAQTYVLVHVYLIAYIN